MDPASVALNMLDSLCGEEVRTEQHTEPVDSSSKKRKALTATGEEKAPKRSSRRISKKAQKAAEQFAAEQEAAEAAAEKEKAENRAHEIELAKASRSGTDVLIKDCIFNFGSDKGGESLRQLAAAAAACGPTAFRQPATTPPIPER